MTAQPVWPDDLDAPEPDWSRTPSGFQLVAAAQARHAAASTQVRDQTPPAAVDPAWDKAPREAVLASVARLYRVAEDILNRHQDPDTGGWKSPVGPFGRGDVTGLSRAILLEVVDPLQTALDQVTGTIGDTIAAIDQHKRQAYGPGYQPDRSTWPRPRSSTGE
jgi:hypothetical protein